MTKTTPRYYTLLCREPDGQWYPQFGDFSRECVEQEANDTYARDYRRADRKIICTGRGQKEIAAKILSLNFHPEAAS